MVRAGERPKTIKWISHDPITGTPSPDAPPMLPVDTSLTRQLKKRPLRSGRRGLARVRQKLIPGGNHVTSRPDKQELIRSFPRRRSERQSGGRRFPPIRDCARRFLNCFKSKQGSWFPFPTLTCPHSHGVRSLRRSGERRRCHAHRQGLGLWCCGWNGSGFAG